MSEIKVMMKTKQTSLKKLLRPNLTQLAGNVIKQFDTEPNIQSVRSCLENQPTNMPWASYRKEILKQLENLLDTPLHSILTRSWIKCEKVSRTATIQLESNLDTVSIVPLRSHSIRSHQQPQITLCIENCENTIIPLAINLNLSLSNVVVKLQYGKIQRVISGLCKGQATIGCGKTVLVKRDIMEFHLLEDTDAINTKTEAFN